MYTNVIVMTWNFKYWFLDNYIWFVHFNVAHCIVHVNEPLYINLGMYDHSDNAYTIKNLV